MLTNLLFYLPSYDHLTVANLISQYLNYKILSIKCDLGKRKTNQKMHKGTLCPLLRKGFMHYLNKDIMYSKSIILQLSLFAS